MRNFIFCIHSGGVYLNCDKISWGKSFVGEEHRLFFTIFKEYNIDETPFWSVGFQKKLYSFGDKPYKILTTHDLEEVRLEKEVEYNNQIYQFHSGYQEIIAAKTGKILIPRRNCWILNECDLTDDYPLDDVRVIFMKNRSGRDQSLCNVFYETAAIMSRRK